jgi:hypothetical protein
MLRKSLLIVTVGVFSLAFFQTVPILAQTQSDQSQTDQEEPAFSNPAQAAHAANLAAAVAAAAQTDDPDERAQIEGQTTEDIAGMRASGMGWGQIAHELGVHPGTLGLGHSKTGKSAPTATEAQLATARDTQTGGAKGHGVSSGGGSAGKGAGHGHASSDQGGKGGGRGNAGSHGGDQGGGQGGGHGGGQGGGHGK